MLAYIEVEKIILLFSYEARNAGGQHPVSQSHKDIDIFSQLLQVIFTAEGETKCYAWLCSFLSLP